MFGIVNDTDGIIISGFYIVSYGEGVHITKRQKVKFTSAKLYL
jgi:hypothetical protein